MDSVHIIIVSQTGNLPFPARISGAVQRDEDHLGHGAAEAGTLM